MTSNMLSGDRRWASAKRGGMTVLGKVVVPKPINLPSQKSENHGLDPNVEIVPKGTLSWGSKSSSAWGSVSPNTDGRPSSGSGTRPSTASSDRANDIIKSNPNSRPASASGVLSSNQTSLASRPRSADTRPGSSQLSRFAEHPDHTVAWTAPGTAEKLGVAPVKNDGFSLASGDFPTLGSGKESSGRDADPQDPSYQGSPGSPSGGVRRANERIGASGVVDAPASENPKNSSVNFFQRNAPPHSDDGGRTGMDNWQGNPQAYPNPPPHFDAWHGAPMNNPQGGVWFRGLPGGAPYGNPILPLEPFPYYRPQMPANSQPRAPHPKNGDMFRPHMPNMPMRPGFYSAPLAYEVYYGPPLGYCGPNEQMGMMAGPSMYHRYPVHGAHEPGNPHNTPGGFDPNSKNHGAEQAESGRPMENRGPPYKVLLKHEEHRSVDLRNNYGNKDEEIDMKTVGEEASSRRVSENQVSASIPVKKLCPEGSETLVLLKNSQPLLAVPKDTSLIKKIEGLNKKARGSDGQIETVNISNFENKKNPSQANARSNQNTKVVNLVSHEEPANKSLDRTAGPNTSRRPESRIDQHGRGRNNPQEIEGRQKKPLISEPPVVASALNLKASNIQEQDHHISTEVTDNIHGKPEGPAPILDKEQRAKMRELAKQRTKQLQEEEEERTKRQMAKARAKLEELNRRSQAPESSSSEKAENRVEESESLIESSMAGKNAEQSKSTAGSKPNTASQRNERDIVRLEKPLSPEPPILPTLSSNPPKASENVPKQKRGGFKQKQHPLITEAIKIEADTEACVTANAEIKANEVLPSVNPTDACLQPRKKHNKNGRNKHKSEDKSAPSIIPPESSQPKASDLVVPAQHPELHPSSPYEDSHGRSNTQWKPHQTRRMLRNPQNSKPEAVVWAPVRSQNKPEIVVTVPDEARLKTVADDVTSPVKSDSQVQCNPKNKRAEIERYVPKPVAKEMAQQANESVTKAVSVTEEPNIHHVTGIALEPRNGSGRHNNNNNKQGKGHGAWRQRATTELAVSQTSNVTQNYSDDWKAGDDWPVSSNPVQPVPVIKDQGPTSRGKRHGHVIKGHKNSEKKNHGDETDKIHAQSPATETSPIIDSNASSKENRGIADRQTAHWQPKSQALSTNNQRTNRHGSSQNAGSEVAWVNKADSDRPSTHGNDTTESPGQFPRNSEHHEVRRERKPAPPEGQPMNPVDQGPTDSDPRQEHQSSGFRKSGNQNARFVQSQSQSQSQDPAPNTERARQNQNQNPRYEYQPVGPYNNPVGPKEGPEGAGPRVRGRGQNHTRRGAGNFYGRQSGFE